MQITGHIQKVNNIAAAASGTITIDPTSATVNPTGGTIFCLTGYGVYNGTATNQPIVVAITQGGSNLPGSATLHGVNGTGLGAVEFVDALQFRSSGGTITFTMTAGGSAAYDFWVKGFWV